MRWWRAGAPAPDSAAARAVLARATPEDALWLLTADGIPRRGDRASLASCVDSLGLSPRRLDLGAASRSRVEVLAPEPRPGEIVLITDLQASAVGAATPAAPLVVARPDDDPPTQFGVAALNTGAQPWSTDGGRVAVTLAGDSARTVPVTVRLEHRPGRQALATAGSCRHRQRSWRAERLVDRSRRSSMRTSSVWTTGGRVRADRSRGAGATGIRPDRYVAAACEVLAANRPDRARGRSQLGSLGRGFSVL